jgi:hypothetical protein
LPFREYGKQFTGLSPNFPGCWVSPVRTELDSESATCHQAHQVRIKFGVEGSEPEEVAQAAMEYMAAIHRALAASWPGDWTGVLAGGQVMRLFVRGHEYGPLFERGGSMAKFPEMDVVAETQESWDGLEGV